LSDSEYCHMNNKENALKYLFGLSETAIKLGLDNITKILKEFGNPHLQIPSVHIAGTNGKGSVAAMTDSICRKAGMKTGLFTSPHLIEFNERIRINGEPISMEELEKLIQLIQTKAHSLNIFPTFFEFSTIIAFLHFAEQKTDINILETGLGGRLDATNVCLPEIAAITSIAKDHTQYLGEELNQIAFEKASIIKNQGTVLANVKNDSIYKTILDMANKKSAALFRLGEDFKVRAINKNVGGQEIEYQEENFKIASLQLPLLGKYQVENAGLALKICRYLSQRFPTINNEAYRNGIKSTKWPGRLEVCSQKPLIVLDCAHNPSAVKNLTENLTEIFPTSGLKRVVFGVMQDKPYEEMLGILSEWANHIILVKPEGIRSADPEKLQSILRKQENLEVSVIPDTGNALQTVEFIAKDDDIVCITGSFHTVSEAKIYFEKSYKNHIDASDSGIDASGNKRI